MAFPHPAHNNAGMDTNGKKPDRRDKVRCPEDAALRGVDYKCDKHAKTDAAG